LPTANCQLSIPQSAIRNLQLIMSPFLFWALASLTVIFGAGVVINRNPVASALSLVVSFLGLAALFMSLNAFFIGIIQVLVYAGAVMVLFLFIIMLLNLQTEERRRIKWLAAAGGIGVALILLTQIFLVIGHFKVAQQNFPPLAGPTIDDVWHIGALLFRNYNLPFQIIGVLVLVATIGVVLLSKREPR
jgi:NADH-quinone oxidoreductase subunit J